MRLSLPLSAGLVQQTQKKVSVSSSPQFASNSISLYSLNQDKASFSKIPPSLVRFAGPSDPIPKDKLYYLDTERQEFKPFKEGIHAFLYIINASNNCISLFEKTEAGMVLAYSGTPVGTPLYVKTSNVSKPKAMGLMPEI